MGNQEMPNQRLKRFGVRSNGGSVDDGDEYASVSDLRGVPSITADYPTNSGTNFLGVFESPYQVGADVLRRVASANRKNKDHVRFVQPGYTKPVGVTRLPALIVHPRGEFGSVVGRDVRFDLRNLAEVARSMGSVPRPAANSK